MRKLEDSISEGVEYVFSERGALARSIPGYQLRVDQQNMSRKIALAYQQDGIFLAEAGTGIGKSFAYLVPALLWAVTKGETTVISTHTIALQEQLLHKDIPFLSDVLGLDVQAVLVKGMSNYLCLRKYEEVLAQSGESSVEEKREMDALRLFLETSKEGAFSEMKIPLSSEMKEKVCAERLSCSHARCPHFGDCFFFKARKSLEEAKILIVNHHLLVAEGAMRLRFDFSKEKSILPRFDRLVVDEAHHLESVALEGFSVTVDRSDAVRILGKIYSDHQPKQSRIGLLKAELEEKGGIIFPSVLTALDIEIPARKRVISAAIDQFFLEIEKFCEQELSYDLATTMRGPVLLPDEKTETPAWTEGVVSRFRSMQEEFRRLFSGIDLLCSELKRNHGSGSLKETVDMHCDMLQTACDALVRKVSDWERFVTVPARDARVRWTEVGPYGTLVFRDAELDVATRLDTSLLGRSRTVIFCSATLTTASDFSFLQNRIGIEGESYSKRTETAVYPSPFDFENRALFCVPRDISFPHEPHFLQDAVASIQEILSVCKGGCFILFTSYDLLKKSHEMILASEKSPSLRYLRQGEASRASLIATFKQEKNAVLFGTSSFWEGVDIPGDALRCVIITKLPFQVPSEPIVHAISERYRKRGKDPFSAYSLPEACLKFKQGFGRLLRSETDRGCVVCLDKRIMTKSYGKTFLKSLPPCPVLYKDRHDLLLSMASFYECGSR